MLMIDEKHAKDKLKAWNMRASTLLISLESDRLDGQNDPSSKEFSKYTQKEQLEELEKGLQECIPIQELESLINEAETLDIYDKNKKYDKLIDFHCKATDLQTEAKKAYSNRNDVTRKLIQSNIHEIVKIGVCFTEVDQLFKFLKLQQKSKESQDKYISYRQLDALLKDLIKNKNMFENQKETIKELKHRRDAFQKIRSKIRKHFKGLD